MALKTFVKIGNVNNLSDARYCAGMYVDLMGFSLEENNEYFVPPASFKEITDWLSGLQYVAEFQTKHPDSILETLKEYEGLDFIQIEEPAHIQMLYNSGYRLILKQTITSNDDLVNLKPIATSLGQHDIILLIEAENGLHQDESTWEIVRNLAKECKILLGFGFDAENVEALLSKTKVEGISMKGGHEIKPGIKDFDELADILEALELED